MAVKKAPAKKKTAVKAAAAKKTPAKKTANKIKKGQKYECAVCGLAITIDEECGCIEACDILCCGKPMKTKASKK